ncbi:MAG: peptide chain release factor N(5)-glutamine methyltransferase [Bacteroidales bacterium]|nr:peptide chain release factor N(5)-glutamine methyltransferase [Bacteroidales bacterium]MBS3775559.1 peptide chain release factor N(5)-glutamine methyltransferase [Bacteroidales bacterium]
MEKNRTIEHVISHIKNELHEIYPEKEINSLTEIILHHVVKLKKTDLLINREQTITHQQLKKIEDITKQLKKQKPIQQILGETEFYNITLKIEPHILIPRQETEELVDWVLKDVASEKKNILDIGTGSGCIAIALAKNLPGSIVTAVDYKPEILDAAKENALLNGVHIRFILADILQDDLPPGQYDLIVSNPPYVRNSEKKFMSQNVLNYEPSEALFVEDEDPLIFYRKIIHLAGKHLVDNGFLYFEINEYLGEETVRLLEKHGFNEICLKKDLNNKNRMIKAQK